MVLILLGSTLTLHEIQYDPNTLPSLLQRNIWMVWDIVVAPLVVVALCQHVADDPPKTCYRLVYHQKIITQIFEGRA